MFKYIDIIHHTLYSYLTFILSCFITLILSQQMQGNMEMNPDRNINIAVPLRTFNDIIEIACSYLSRFLLKMVYVPNI